MTGNFINDCVKCISMCNKEFSSEIAEWIEKLILTKIAGSDNDDLTDGSCEQSCTEENDEDTNDFRDFINRVSSCVEKCENCLVGNGTKFIINEDGNITVIGDNITFKKCEDYK